MAYPGLWSRTAWEERLTVDVPPQLTAREMLAAELRHARALAGISGRVLARRTGISQSKVSDDPRLAALEKFRLLGAGNRCWSSSEVNRGRTPTNRLRCPLRR